MVGFSKESVKFDKDTIEFIIIIILMKQVFVN